MERSVSEVSRALTGAFETARAKTRGAENAPPAPSKPELFDAVRRMGGQATELGVASILEAYKATSEKTRVQYRRIVKRRMLDHGGRPDLSDISRSSWYPTRAALRAGLAGRYQMAKRDYDKQVKAGDLAGAAKSIQRAQTALDDLEAVSNAKAPPAEKVSQSARQHLPKVKDGTSWQAKVYGKATEAQKPAIAVLWATGCRPAELARGVDVFVDKANGALCVRIPGAKVNDAKNAGQPVRVLVINKNTQAGRALLAVLDGAERVQVKRAAKRINKDFLGIRPKLPAGWVVSAYSFRHQAAANMKADLGDPSKVAAAMGHRSTRSQQHYGTARQKQAGGGAVLSAGATHKPKENRGMTVSPPTKAPIPSGNDPTFPL